MSEINNISPDEWVLIEAYLQGRLAGEDLLHFEQRLTTDSNWRKKVEEARLFVLGIQESVLEGKLKQFHQSVDRAPLKSIRAPKISWKKWIAAAAVLFVASTGLFYLTKKNTLFDRFYTPDEGLPTYMGVTDHYEFEKAMVDYKMGQYKEAIVAWKELLKESPDNDTLSYFIGSALMADKDMKQAQLYFNKVANMPGSVFIQSAKWYKALLLLKEGNKKEASDLLKLTEHPNKEALLRKLQE